MAYEQTGIRCPRFSAQERICVGLTEQINAARTAVEKAARAEDLIEVVQELLDCEEYEEEESLDCQYCRNVSLLRKKTAELVRKASALAH
ncbi:MAG: hypothetical protein ISS50_04920 [Anaerolineae bacterium]|nr:hypothetical protein [Anaerolineae bacterium]